MISLPRNCGYNNLMGGYHLYRSSNLESFPDRFPDLFLNPHPLADSVFIVVQNAGLGEWLIRYLAGKKGAVMGPRILMPEQAIRRFVTGYPSARDLLIRGSTAASGKAERSLLFMDGLKVTLYKVLDDAIRSGDAVFDPLRRYLSGKESRLWPLADALAGIFHHYGLNCRNLVESWDRSTSVGAGPAEAWQLGLWRRLFRPEAPYTHLSRLLSTVAESEDRCDLPMTRIVLFGSMFLGEQGLEFFRRLADDLDVHHFVLSPTAHRATLRTSFLEKNALLSRGFETLVSRLAPTSEDEHWPNPGVPGSTLHRLRDSFIRDASFSGPVKDDGSLSLHDVAGPRRSIEVLKDRILQALCDDTELAPTEIGVLAPDITVYAPYLEIVFPSLDGERSPKPNHLPFNLTDLPPANEAPFPAGLSALMDLPGSRLGRGAVIDLIENPCFAPTAGKPYLVEAWKSLIEQMQVRWGVDENHRRSEGATDARSGSWGYAFERILAGYYHDEGDAPEMLPLATAGDAAADDAGLLMNVVRELDEQIRRLEERVMSLREWTLLWERIVARWLVAGDGDKAGRLTVKKAFRDLIALCDDVDDLSDFSDGGLPWSVFRSLLNEFRSKSPGGRRGRYLARGITCASLKPTRAIPFRRIYVLGLDEGVWPGRDFLSSFDLRESLPKSIDLSRESVDRLALLEVFFSASEHLSLFYTGRDPERGEALAPAAPVLELLNHLGEGGEKLIRRHPLAPFAPEALTGSGPLATGSPEALALARARRGISESPGVRAGPLPPDADRDNVDWRELTRFLKNPVEHFFRRRLGAVVVGLEEDRDDGDVLEVDTLLWWKWRQHLIAADLDALNRPETVVRAFQERLALEAAFSQTPVGNLQAERWRKDAEALADQLKRVHSEGLDLGHGFSCRYAAGTLSSIENAGGFDLPAPKISPPGTLPLLITGSVGGLGLLTNGDEPDSRIWTMVDFISSSSCPLPSVHNIESWTASLLLASTLGESCPEEIRVFRIGGRDFDARRYYFRLGDRPEGAGGEKILLENPHKILRALVGAYRNGEQTPLFLYPELADQLAENPGDETSPEVLGAAANAAWSRILSDTHTSFSTLRDCPWRARFVREPDFTSPAFYRAWRDLYVDGGLL